MQQVIDLTGLPQPIVQDIQRLVASLRASVFPSPPTFDQTSAVTLDEFERSLDELCEGLPPFASLPSDFSRADIYADHN